MTTRDAVREKAVMTDLCLYDKQSWAIPWRDANCYLPQGENEQRRCASCTVCCSALWVMQLSSSFETHPDTNMPITLSAFTNHALSQFCVVRHLPWQQMCVHGLRGQNTINSFALGLAFCCQHTECDPWETAAASWPPESLLAQWGWHPVPCRWETDEATAVFQHNREFILEL